MQDQNNDARQVPHQHDQQQQQDATTTTTIDQSTSDHKSSSQKLGDETNSDSKTNSEITKFINHESFTASNKVEDGNLASCDITQVDLIGSPAPPVALVPATSITNISKSLNIADFVGELGFYQLSLAILTLVRYVCVAMMTNTGPLIAPRIDHTCHPPSSIEPFINYPTNTSHSAFLVNKCELPLKNGSQFECTNWLYNTTEHGVTLTDTYDLVCGRDWFRSVFQSSVSVGVTVASIVFGSFSDEHGRRMTLRTCYLISLIAGLLSVWAPTFSIYTISRAICSMSDLGIVSALYTLIVETFGNKYRATTCLIVFTGWSMGVMVMPFVTDYFMNFKRVMLFTVVCHAATLPWVLTVGESIRWSLVNGRIEEANNEIRRICKWNSVGQSELEKVEDKFQASKEKYHRVAERKQAIKAQSMANGQNKPAGFNRFRKQAARAFFGGFFKVGQILKSRELTITTIVMVWTTFNSELLYMLFILINSDVGDNVALNYAIGGVMEVLATVISIVMFARLTRRFSLSSTMTVISVSIFVLALTHQQATVAVWVLNFTKFAISTLSSLIYVTVTELYPTSVRQTGMGLSATLGSIGAVIAPFIRTELTDMIGMTYVMLALCLLPLSAALLIPLRLRETKGLELPDEVDEIS